LTSKTAKKSTLVILIKMKNLNYINIRCWLQCFIILCLMLRWH